MPLETHNENFQCTQIFSSNSLATRARTRKLHSIILNLDEISLTKLLLYGDSEYANKVNKKDIISFCKFRPLYKAVWRLTDVTLFLNLCLLAISLSFCKCKFYALRFYILCLVTWT